MTRHDALSRSQPKPGDTTRMLSFPYDVIVHAPFIHTHLYLSPPRPPACYQTVLSSLHLSTMLLSPLLHCSSLLYSIAPLTSSTPLLLSPPLHCSSHLLSIAPLTPSPFLLSPPPLHCSSHLHSIAPLTSTTLLLSPPPHCSSHLHSIAPITSTPLLLSPPLRCSSLLHSVAPLPRARVFSSRFFSLYLVLLLHVTSFNYRPVLLPFLHSFPLFIAFCFPISFASFAL